MADKNPKAFLELSADGSSFGRLVFEASLLTDRDCGLNYNWQSSYTPTNPPNPQRTSVPSVPGRRGTATKGVSSIE